MESPVSYLGSTVPAAACEMAIVFRSAGCACFALSCPIYLSTVSLLRYFLRPTAAMTKKVTGDELSARAKANGYQRGAHRDKNSLRDQTKHVDRVKMHQNTALDRCVL